MLRETQQLLFLSQPPHQTWGHWAKPKTMKFRPRSLQWPRHRPACRSGTLSRKHPSGHGRLGSEAPPPSGQPVRVGEAPALPGPTSHGGRGGRTHWSLSLTSDKCLGLLSGRSLSHPALPCLLGLALLQAPVSRCPPGPANSPWATQSHRKLPHPAPVSFRDPLGGG